MSATNSCWSFLAAVAVGMVGLGCGPDSLPGNDHLRSRGSPLFTQNWNLVGTTFGTSAHDELLDIWVTSSGDVHVAGYENGQLGHTSVDPSGDSRGVIYHLNSNLVQWGKSTFGHGNGASDVIEALAMRPGSSDVYFAGRTTGSYNNTPNAGQFDTIAGWVDSFLMKRTFQYGTNRPQHPQRLALDNNGGVIISGYDDIYIPTNYVEAWEDPFVLKLRRENNVLSATPDWTLQFNTSVQDLMPGMTSSGTPGSPIYISGATLNGTSRGMFVKQVLPNGTSGWSIRPSTISLDMAAALAIAPDGNLLFTGTTYAQLGSRSFGEQDVVVQLLNVSQNGAALWIQQHGTEVSEWVTDMAVDALGNIYVVGETLGSFDPSFPNQGENDIFLLKLDPNGALEHAFQIGSPADERPTSVAVDAAGNVYVAGYTMGALIPGKSPKGGRDGFVLRVTPPGDIEI